MKDKFSWGGKRQCAGRKKTCLKRISFNRRIDEKVLNILKEYAKNHNITETEALESAILLQTNLEKLKGEMIMKIAIPTAEGKLCAHFGHCEIFSFAEVNPETKEIIEIITGAPEEGISCQSANWIAAQGASVVLAGGIGGRPMMALAQNGVQVVSGCPELDVSEVVKLYLDGTLQTGENACGKDENHSCHGGHGEGHHCGHGEGHHGGHGEGHHCGHHH